MVKNNVRGAFKPVHIEIIDNHEEAWKRYRNLVTNHVLISGERIKGIYNMDNIIYYREDLELRAIVRKVHIKTASGIDIEFETVGKEFIKKYGEIKSSD